MQLQLNFTRRRLLHRITALSTASLAAPAVLRAQPRTAWVIGRSLPLTGPQSVYGIAKRDGGDALAAMISAKGGIAGRLLKFETLDDAYDEAKTASNVKQLAQEKSADLFTGFFGAPHCAAAAKELTTLGLPAVGFTTGANVFKAAPQKMIFPVRASFTEETAAIARNQRTVGVTNAAIVYVNIPFGQLAKRSFEAACTAEKIALTAQAELKADGSDATAVITSLPASAGVIFLALHTPAAIAFVKALRTAGGAQQVWCLSAVDASVLARALGPQANGTAISQVVPSPTRRTTEISRQYTDALKGSTITPSYYGLEAFIEMRILADALARVKGSSSDAIVAALESLGRYDLGGFDVRYGSGNRAGSNFVDLTIISRNMIQS
jgi:branched-chain amino acid transport system substrate-binding protein